MSAVPGVPDLPLPEEFRTYRWGWAPQGLATTRQLRAQGLRPAKRREPVSEIRWRRGDRVAYLHRIDEAVPVQPPTAQQSAALAAAMRARKTCTECGTEADYVLPTRFTGSPQCLDCLDATDNRANEEHWSAAMNDQTTSPPSEDSYREQGRKHLRSSLAQHQEWRDDLATAHPTAQRGLHAETAAQARIMAAEPDQRWQVAVDTYRDQYGTNAAASLEKAAAGIPYDENGFGFYTTGQAAGLVAGLGFDVDRVEAALSPRLDEYGHLPTNEMVAAIQELIADETDTSADSAAVHVPAAVAVDEDEAEVWE
ncbi:hypothetical protein LWF15_13905 [Kineosporia rhizophila]|uniref:RRQRL motif-containing zinc-binding protein n=1 Tax=Kineosporia rhizophila TaxID=84633 RepID=UPI001E5427D5|nr:RRQRL motif-containing zinc-binding protein [Kineosporia rhizophila]MCE0536602.1 hypothetical protein [Kineosporia rhizophila]